MIEFFLDFKNFYSNYFITSKITKNKFLKILTNFFNKSIFVMNIFNLNI